MSQPSTSYRVPPCGDPVVSHSTTTHSGRAKWRVSSQRMSGMRSNISFRNWRTLVLPVMRVPHGSLPNEASKTTSSVIWARIPSMSCPFHTVLKRSTNASPSKLMRVSSSVAGRHAPAEHRPAFEPAKEQVLYQQTDQDHREQPGEDEVGVHLEPVLVDEPPEAALAAGHAEHHLGRDDRSPGKGPADLEPRQDIRERRRQQDAGHQPPAGEAEVLADAPQRRRHRDEPRIGV